MKQFSSLLLLGMLFFFSCHSWTKGQAKPQVTLHSITQVENTVKVNLTSSSPFIVGDNYYVFYVGGRGFDKSEMKYVDGVERMSFLLTQDEFHSLQEGAPMYVTYGAIDPEEDMEMLATKTKICWSLGAFSASLLK